MGTIKRKVKMELKVLGKYILGPKKKMEVFIIQKNNQIRLL